MDLAGSLFAFVEADIVQVLEVAVVLLQEDLLEVASQGISLEVAVGGRGVGRDAGKHSFRCYYDVAAHSPSGMADTRRDIDGAVAVGVAEGNHEVQLREIVVATQGHSNCFH